ncbi:MAG: reverse transcriptase family protein [Oscillospiraceae bacterium]
MFRPPNTSVPEFLAELEIILEKVSAENKPFYLMGDFNVDLLNNNNESQSFMNLLFSYGLYPRVDRPTRITSKTATLIDNIFTNVHDIELNSGVRIADLGSDHLPVYTILPSNAKTVNIHQQESRTEYITKRIYSDENINNFKIALNGTDWSPVYMAIGAQNKYTCFENIINILISKHFPTTRVKMKTKQIEKPWISKAILNSIRKKNAMYKAFIKNRSAQLEDRYKKYKNKLIAILRTAEKNYYTEKLNKVQGNMSKTWTVLNEIMAKKQMHKTIKQITIDNNTITDQQTIANKFNEFFVNIGPTLAKKIPVSNNKLPVFQNPDCADSMFMSPTDHIEVKDIICNLKDTGCSNNYDLPVKIIKECNNELSKILAYINNESISDGIFPDQLKIARVTPIFKAGDKNCITNYRPKSVLPVISKISEKIIYKRLLNYLNSHNILSKNQFGFRPGVSTSMALLKLIDDLSRVMDEGEYAVGIFIDLAKAFDTVNHNILLHKLNHYGIRGTVHKWFKSYLSNRQQHVNIGSRKSEITARIDIRTTINFCYTLMILMT